MDAKTNKNQYIGLQARGYMINTFLEQAIYPNIEEIQLKYLNEFGPALWLTPKETLHVTLMDWVAPLVDYNESKEALFDEIYSSYNKIFEECIRNLSRIHVIFNQFIVGTSAIAIIADQKSTDVFNKIRQDFLAKTNLLPGTKPPANILHCTIVRFTQDLDIRQVTKFAKTYRFQIPTDIKKFTLVREDEVPMQKYSLLKEYLLK